MKTLKLIIITVCIISTALSAFGAVGKSSAKRGEVIAVLKTPAGIALTEESLKNGAIRKYIEITAEAVGAEVANVFDSLSLMNREGNIFVFMVSDKMSSEELASALKADPNVVSASPNREVHLIH